MARDEDSIKHRSNTKVHGKKRNRYRKSKIGQMENDSAHDIDKQYKETYI